MVLKLVPCFSDVKEMFLLTICSCHEAYGNDMHEASVDHYSFGDGFLGIGSNALAFLPFNVGCKRFIGVYELLKLLQIIILNWDGNFCILGNGMVECFLCNFLGKAQTHILQLTPVILMDGLLELVGKANHDGPISYLSGIMDVAAAWRYG